MRRKRHYPVLRVLLKPFHRTQQKTLFWVMRAILHVGTGASLGIAAWLADRHGIRLDSALNRLYRLLRNSRVSDLDLSRQMLRIFTERLGERLLIPVDWTEWHPPLRMLVAAVVVGSRAIPIHVAAFAKHLVPRSQNVRENNFARTLAMLLEDVGRQAVILCDRGFRRVSFLGLLLKLHLGFVVRLIDDVHVHLSDGTCCALEDLGLAPGQFLDLGIVALRQDAAVDVRVIGIWKLGAAEPWWLATNLTDSVAEVAALYDRRMCVEQQFRDVKGCRFGSKLFWAQLRKPEHLARMTLLLGIALFIWTAAGAVAVAARADWRFTHKTKGARLSYVTIGRRVLGSLTAAMPLTARLVQQHLPAPTLRMFSWLPTAT